MYHNKKKFKRTTGGWGTEYWPNKNHVTLGDYLLKIYRLTEAKWKDANQEG